jgi:hypothetical protein
VECDGLLSDEIAVEDINTGSVERFCEFSKSTKDGTVIKPLVTKERTCCKIDCIVQ